MMKKLLLFAVVSVVLAACSNGKGSVEINLPKDFSGETLVVSHVTIDNIFKAKKQEDLKIVYDTLEVKNGSAHLELDKAGAARYNIESPVMSTREPDFYASPDDELTVNIKSFEPLDFEVSGSELMEDMTRFLGLTQPIQQEYITLVTTKEDVTEDELKVIMDLYLINI